LQGSPAGEARREVLVADTGMRQQDKMDVNTAIVLLKIRTNVIGAMELLDPEEDKEAFHKAIAKLIRVTVRIDTMPPLVVQVARESIEREEAYYGKVAPPDMEDIEFEELQEVFAQYRQATTPEEIIGYLSTFHGLAATWVNKYKDSSRNVERVGVVIQVRGYVEKQIVSSAEAQAEQIYLNAVLGTGEIPLQTITNYSVDGVSRNVKGKGEQGGLSEAYIAAIRIFTGPDYGVINPTVARDNEWLQANKKRSDTGKAFEDIRDPTWGERALDRLRKKEGPLTAGFMHKGLLKLPVFPGTVYRAWGIDQKELDGMEKSGEYVFVTDTSCTKQESVTKRFTSTIAKKPISVIATIEKSGGRDISKFSDVQSEEEVTVPAGTRYRVTDIKKISPNKYTMKFTGPG
jgi:hypothetical protein